MRKLSTIQYIKEILPEDTWPWVIPALRQDTVVWESIHDQGFLELALQKIGSQPTGWSAKNLALLTINEDFDIESPTPNLLESLSPNIIQEAEQVYQQCMVDKSLVLDLHNSGMLALYLYDHPNIPIPEGWRTTLACLFTLVEESGKLITQLSPEVAVHTVLSNPLTPGEQEEIFTELVKESKPESRLSILKTLALQRSELATSIAQELCKKPSVALDVFDPENTYHEDVDHLSRILANNEYQRIANLQADYLGNTHKAFEVASGLRTKIMVHIIEQHISNGAIGEASVLWTKYQSLVNEKDIAKIIIALESHGFGDKIFTWFDNLPPKTPDFKKPLNNLVHGIVSFRKGSLDQAYSAACQALTEYMNNNSNLDQIHLTSKLFFKLGKPEDAIRAINLILQFQPNNIDAIKLLSVCYQAINNMEMAIQTAHLAVGLSPNKIELRRILAQTLETHEQWSQALLERETIIELEDSPEYEDMLKLAVCALQSDHPQRTAAICQQMLQESPEDAEANRLLGEAHIALGNPLKAKEHLLQSTQIDPALTSSWIALAGIYKNSDQKRKFRETLLAANHANPEDTDIQLALGKSYLEENELTKAQNFLQKAFGLLQETNLASGIKKKSEVAESLGLTLHRLGHIDKAIHVLENAYRMDPNHIGIAKAYASLLLSTDKSESAIPILSEAGRKMPNDPEVNLAYARACLAASTNYEEAKDAMLRILEAEPGFSEAKALLAEAYERSGEFKDAYTTYKEALSTQLKDIPTWNTHLSLGLARVSIEIGEPDTAIAALKGTLAINDQDLKVLQTLSLAYMAADLSEQSLEAAKSALRVAPDDEDNLDWFINQAVHLGATDLAIKALNQSLETNQEQPSLLAKLGWLYMHDQKTELAKEIFEKTKKIDPITPSNLYTVSKGFLALNEFASAVESLDKAIYLNQKTMENELLSKLLSAKVIAQQSNGDLDGALRTIDESISNISDDPKLIEKKSEILHKLNKFEAAKSCLREGIEKFPNNPRLTIRAALIHRDTGELINALSYAQKALRLVDDDSDALFKTVAALIYDLCNAMLHPSYAKEIIDSEGTTDWDPKPGDLLYYCLRAESALDSEEEIAAIKALTAALKINPDHPRVLAIKARISYHQGDTEVATEYLQKGLEVIGRYPRSNDSLITIEEVSDYFDVEQLASDYIALSEASLLLQQWSVSICLLQKAIDLAPKEPISYLMYARTLVLRAEIQRFYQLLDIVTHAPGQSTTAEYVYHKFEDAILKAAHLISEISPKEEDYTKNHMEAKSTIATWLARGQAIFQPSSEHAQALANNTKTLEDRVAHIAALRYCGALDESVRTAHLTYQETGDTISNPLLLGQIAVTITKDDPNLAFKISQTANEISIWENLGNQPVYYAIKSYIAGHSANSELQLQAIQSAIEGWPDEPKWLALAADLIQNQLESPDLSLAAQYLDKAVQLEVKQVSHYLTLADIYNKLDNLEQVIRVLEKATNSIPQQPAPWLGLAQAYHQLGDIPQTIRCANKVVEVDSANSEAYLLLAKVALEISNPQKASSYVDEVLTLDPENIQALLVRFKIFKALDMSEDALSTLNEILPRMTDSIFLQLERVRLIKRIHGEFAALENLEILDKKYPGNTKILALLAETYSNCGDQESAIRNAQEAITISQENPENDDHPGLLLLLGRLLRKSGQLDQAIHNFSEAIKLTTENPVPYIELGRCYQEQRQYERALNHLQNAIAIAPENSQAYYYSGLVLKESKDYEQAEVMFKRASNLAPNDLNIHRQLGAVTAINLVHSHQRGSRLTNPAYPMEL